MQLIYLPKTLQMYKYTFKNQPRPKKGYGLLVYTPFKAVESECPLFRHFLGFRQERKEQKTEGVEESMEGAGVGRVRCFIWQWSKPKVTFWGWEDPPKVVYFKGFWDVQRGTGVLTHCNLTVFGSKRKPHPWGPQVISWVHVSFYQ